MRIRLLLIILLAFCCNFLLAQTISVHGHITNKNRHNLSGVTIAVGETETSSDEKGDFTISADLNVFINRGIWFSYVGFIKQHLIYQPNHFYEIEMGEKTIVLNEVIVGEADNILKRACKNISKNYPDKATILTGILRDQVTRNKSSYFKSDAVVKAYVPPYTSNEETSVKLVQNKIDSINDKSLSYLRDVEDYNIIADFDIVHRKDWIRKLSNKSIFDYILIGKQLYDDHKVFVIDVSIKDTTKTNNQIDMVLYVDTVSYAFIAININRYNLERLGFVRIGKQSCSVIYQYIDKKWYIKEIHDESHHIYKNEAPEKKIDFIRTQIDTVNITPFAYKDIIQNRDDVELLSKSGNKEEWLKYDTLFAQAETEKQMSIISTETLDTIRQKNLINNSKKQNQPFSKQIINYIRHNNIEEAVEISKLSINIINTAKGATNISNYGFGAAIYFRLYSNLFFDLQQYSNFRNSTHTGISESSFYLSNEFNINKNAHKITLTPYAGYGFLIVSDKYNEVNYDNLNVGLRTSYELTHRKALFISATYNTASDTRNFDELNIMPTHYTISTGILFKL